MKNLAFLFLAFICFKSTAQERQFGTDTLTLEGVTVFSKSQSELFSKDSIALLQELETMCKADQKFRKNRKYYMEHITEQNAIDSANVLRLMQISERYGFPSTKRFKYAGTGILPYAIFVHTPSRYRDTVRPLIEKEFKNNSITQAEYAHIIWHLDGREGIPGIEGAEVKKRRNGKVVQKIRKQE